MIDDFIKFNNDKITTILSPNNKSSNFITRAIVDNYGNKYKCMVWQNDDTYYPCARIVISQRMSFQTMFFNYKFDFDILIINAMTDEANRYEIEQFMKDIKTCECFKGKKIIIIFDKDKGYDFAVSLDIFNLHKGYILEYSDFIYKLMVKVNKLYNGKLSLTNIIDKEKTNYNISGDSITFEITKIEKGGNNEETN